MVYAIKEICNWKIHSWLATAKVETIVQQCRQRPYFFSSLGPIFFSASSQDGCQHPPGPWEPRSYSEGKGEHLWLRLPC